MLPVISRLFEKLIFDQLYDYLKRNQLIFLLQSAFRKLHSVLTCLLKSTNDWYLNTDKGKYTAAVFIDLKKAFDTVDHERLLNKLNYYGVRGKELSWFRSYLFNRKQFCRVNGPRGRLWSSSGLLPRTPTLSSLRKGPPPLFKDF